jgi:hypothetical protein
MVKKTVKLELAYKDDTIELTIINKMGHSIITHPMRLKFAKTVVLRKGEIIWSNFKESPQEDKEATFMIVFKDSEGKPAMPHTAVEYLVNQNLKAMSAKSVKYSVPQLQKGDEIQTTWVSYVVNPKVAQKLQITSEEATKAYIGAKESIVVR